MVMGFYGFVDHREQLWFVAVLNVGSLPVLMLTVVCTVSERKPDRVGDRGVVGWAADVVDSDTVVSGRQIGRAHV
jgi:hypothetical protein